MFDLPPDTNKTESPIPPLIEVREKMAPECRYLTNTEAQEAFNRLKARLPGTSFEGARPSEICGLVRVTLKNGTAVYTEPTGRYLMFTFALDTHKGSPADTSYEIERQIERRQSYPKEALPGVLPGIKEPNW